MKQEIYGHLTLESMATHVPHKFKVPDGTKTLRLEFAHTPEHPGVGNIPHQLSISVYGPNGAGEPGTTTMINNRLFPQIGLHRAT